MEALFPADPARRRRLARALLGFAVLLAVFLVLRAVRKQGGVMELNRAFGERFLAGADPWLDPASGERRHGPYPPSFAWVAVPLSLPPILVARALWATLQVAALCWIYALLARRARESFPRAAEHVPMLFAASLLLASRFLLRDFAGGGGNLVYGALAFAGLELGLCGRPLPAGLALGLSLALKPNLAPLLAALALRRRFSAAASALLFAALFFWLPALWYGPERYAGLAREWGRGVVEYALLEDLQSSALVPAGLPAAEDGMNQSLREAVQRLVRPPGDTGAVDVQLFELSPEEAAWVARALALALALRAAVAAWRARSARSEFLAVLAFLPLALLCSPITWKSHHAALVPVGFALACLAFERGRAGRPLWTFLILYWLCCDLLSEDVAGKAVKRALQAASVVTWFDAALLFALARGSEREDRAQSAARALPTEGAERGG